MPDGPAYGQGPAGTTGTEGTPSGGAALPVLGGQPAQAPDGQRLQGQWPAVRQPPPRRRRSGPPERELRQRAIAALVFGMFSLFALLFLGSDLRRGVYLLIFSAILGLAACVIGISAVVKARRTGAFRPRGAVGGIVLGAIAVLISVLVLATYLAFPTQVNQYVQCLSQAQTPADRQACMQQFYKTTHLRAPGVASAAPEVTVFAAGSGYGSADGPPGRRGGSFSGWSAAHRSR